MDNSKFAHLHIHNEYSQLDGLGTAEDYAKRAEELEFKYIALTNHGNVDGIIKWQEACKNHNIKPLFGCEFYIVEDVTKKIKKEKKHHITILAKNLKGLESIMRLLTRANVEGFFYKPRIDPEMLKAEVGNIVVMSACTSTFLWMDSLIVVPLLDAIGYDDVYIELMPHTFNLQLETNRKVLGYANKFKLKTVATNDCHYPLETGAMTQEVLLAMQRKVKWNDPKRWKFDITGLYLKTADEMIAAFKQQNQLDRAVIHKSMRNTIEVAEKCIFDIKQKTVFLPKVPGYEKRDESKLLKNLVAKGLKERLVKPGVITKDQIAEYEARIEEEYNLICELEFQRYFLIVWELIQWCKKNDIMTGPGRGSVGGCLVAYCLYITDVDPIKYGLVFARFISPARIDLPDIDMDFEDVRRKDIKKHLEDLYGKDHVTSLSTFLTMKGKLAIRDVGRVFDVPIMEVNKASKSIVTRSGGDFRSDFTIEDAFNTFEDGIKFKAEYPEVVRIAMDLEGQVKASGKHAAAMCISYENLKGGSRTNLASRKGELISNWDKYDAEYMGIMKLDVLGLSALTVLNQTKKAIKTNHNIDIKFDKIPLDDKKTLKEASLGHTIGAFQIGGIGLAQYCRELEINKFDDIVHATALWRPGTLRTGMTAEFTARKHGRKEIKYIHPILEEKTKETQGIILYQEQVMWLMYELAGLGWRTCDFVRKVISKSQGDAQFASFKQQFIDGCLEQNTLDEENAGKLWDGLSSFGSYSFNKSHTVEYSLITYWDMWCKTNYPKEFLAASLTHLGTDKKQELIDEARRLDVEIALPKIKYSHSSNWIADPQRDIIYCPFLELKGVGDKTADQIQNLNGDGFYSGKGRKPNKNVMSKLQKIRAFSDELIPEEEEDELSKYFDFSLSKDPMRHFRKLHDRLKVHITNIEDVNFEKTSKESELYFGKAIEIRFGYRRNVEKARDAGGNISSVGMKDQLGGVYGTIKDETRMCMIVFGGKIYAEKKDKTEHCEGKWLLAKAHRPDPTNTIFCSNFWDEDDLNSCNLENFDINLLEDRKFRNRKVIGCNDCELRSECTKPVPNSTGKTNIMLLGEAPGRGEDKAGEGFVGKAGDKLWQSLAIDDLYREDFHINNVVKCFPSKTKTPKRKHIKACKRHMDEEMEKINPPLVLAFGNTCLKFFKDKDSGIMDLSGTTEWNSTYGCWICWCIHPASTLYDSSNDALFEQGIANFVDKISYVTNLF